MALNAKSLLFSKNVPVQLQERMHGFLVAADRDQFLYSAALAGSFSLAYASFLRFRSMKERVNLSVAAGRMDPFMGNNLIRGSALGVISGASTGAILGAGIGNIVFNTFHKVEDL